MPETLSGGEQPQPSIAELEEIQKRHLAEEEAKAQATAKAGEEAEERLDLIADVQKVQREIDEKKARGELEPEISYADLETGHHEAQERLERLRKIIEGVPADKVAKELSEGIAQTMLQVEDLKNKLDQAEAIGKLEKIKQRIAEIEANPAMFELLLAEAKTEDQIRGEVVREALAGSGRQLSNRALPERQEYLKDLIQVFLTEEFAAREISKIKDPEEQARQMRVLAQNIISGLSVDTGGGRMHEYEGPAKKDIWTGVLLHNLIGAHGTVDGTTGFLHLAELGFSRQDPGSHTEEGKKSIGQAISKHLRTLNFMRAYAAGIQSRQVEDRLIPRFGNWQGFDREIWGTGFSASENRPILPKNVGESEKAKIQEEFERVKERAVKIEEGYKQKEEAEKTATIQQLESQIQELRAILPQIEQAEAVLKDATDYQVGQKVEGLTREIVGAKDKITDLERRISHTEWELKATGVLSFSRRGRLRDELSDHKAKLFRERNRLETDQQRLDQLQKAKSLVDQHGPKYQVESKIRDLENRLERVRKGY